MDENKHKTDQDTARIAAVRDCQGSCYAAYDAAPKGSVLEQATANAILSKCLSNC